MIKSKLKTPKKLKIDLTGPQGNAYYILGVAKQLAKTLNKDYQKIQKDMMVGDYDNLIKIFEREFGDIVTLYQ